MKKRDSQTTHTTRSTSENLDDHKDKIITDDDVNRLASEIFFDCSEATDEADRIARALLKIVDVLAYEPDDVARSSAAVTISRAIYARTRDCCDSMDRFAMFAGARFGETYPTEKAG